MNLNALKDSVIAGFLDRCVNVGGMAVDLARNLAIYANPTEEIAEAGLHRKPIKLFSRGGRLTVGGGARARLEENYLFDTRCFAAGTLAASEYLFFQNAVGQPAVNNGFPTGVTSMTELETNMDVAGQIAQGKNFVFNQIGVSFNADILTEDAATLMEAGALKYEKQGGETTLRHGVVRLWPGGTGVHGYSTASSVTAAHNGIADIRSARKLSIPRVIKEKESFAYKYLVPRAVRNTDGSTSISLTAASLMTIWLWGGQQNMIPV